MMELHMPLLFQAVDLSSDIAIHVTTQSHPKWHVSLYKKIDSNLHIQMLQRWLTLCISNTVWLRWSILTYNSMAQSPSWKANRFSASPEIPCILGNPKINYRVYKSRPLVHIRSQINPFLAPLLTSLRSILILSSHLRLGLPNGPFPQVSAPKPCKHLSSHPYVLHVPPIREVYSS